MLGLAWYHSTPAGQAGSQADHRQVYIRRSPRLVVASQLGKQSGAWQEKQYLNASIERLRNLKQPSYQQQRQLDRLEQRKHLLNRMADYQLRLQLHAADSSFDSRPLRLKLENLRLQALQQVNEP